MILIFDLDDTLYKEKEFVKSGFKAVSRYLHLKFKLNEKKIFLQLLRILKKNGRGKIFDILCFQLKLKKIFLVKKLVQVYRTHEPKISLNKDAIKILKHYSEISKYIITDGNYLVQKKKIRSLKVEKYFKKIYYTNYYGIKYNKPSLFCFNKIKKKEKVNWNELVYIGDNPKKDFFNCNKKKMLTIRLMKGEFKNLKVSKHYDAKYKIKKLSMLKKKLNLNHNDIQ
jgi:putative hydrolase of the HAD superfamily